MKTPAMTSFFPFGTISNPHTAVLSGLGVVLIVLAASILYLPVFHWLILKMSLANGYLHLLALLGLLGLGVYRLRSMQDRWFHFPVLVHPGALIWIPASILYLFNEANVGFHTLSAALFIVFLYGLAGHFLATAIWRAVLLPMLLLILVLPFEHYLDIYLGFPLRLLSAEMASSLLKLTQLPLVTIESILLVDNKAAIVDLDCSGINSLWIGLIFYLLLTWIERFVIDLRWALIGLGFMGLLVLANVFRIVILVMLDQVLDLPELARLFHQSLGLLGFAISSLVIWWIMQHFAKKRWSNEPASASRTHHNPLAPYLLFTLIAIFASLYQPYQAVAKVATSHELVLPSAYHLRASKLTRQEEDFFVSNNSLAQKYMLDVPVNGKILKASLVLVWSHAWKTHHVPENCYLSQGYSISDKGLWQIKPHYNVRYLMLNRPAMRSSTLQNLTGVYWFQSATHTTPDYSSRVLDNLFHPGREWLMVSILWEQPVTPDAINPFLSTLKPLLESQFHENQ
jgi:exosortase O